MHADLLLRKEHLNSALGAAPRRRRVRASNPDQPRPAPFRPRLPGPRTSAPPVSVVVGHHCCHPPARASAGTTTGSPPPAGRTPSRPIRSPSAAPPGPATALRRAERVPLVPPPVPSLHTPPLRVALITEDTLGSSSVEVQNAAWLPVTCRGRLPRDSAMRQSSVHRMSLGDYSVAAGDGSKSVTKSVTSGKALELRNTGRGSNFGVKPAFGAIASGTWPALFSERVLVPTRCSEAIRRASRSPAPESPICCGDRPAPGCDHVERSRVSGQR
jgi:hypothetical protein